MKIRIAVIALSLASISFAPAEPVNTDYYLPIITTNCAQASIGDIEFTGFHGTPFALQTLVSYPQCTAPLSIQVWDDWHEVPYTWDGIDDCTIAVLFSPFPYPTWSTAHTVTIKISFPNSYAIGERDYGGEIVDTDPAFE